MDAEELYDLESDPHEINNLVTSGKSGDGAALQRLHHALERWIMDSGDQGRIPEPLEVAKAKGSTKPGSNPNAIAILDKSSDGK